MKLKAALSTIVTLSAALILLNVAANGYASMNSNYLWIGYSIFCILTLPNLISKSLLRKKFFGFHSVLLFLVYPIAFIFFFVLSQVLNLDLKNLLSGLFPIFIIFWNYILLSFLAFTPAIEIRRIFDKYKYFLIVAIILLVIFAIVRQPDSIVSLDYLQHQAVVNSIISSKHLCLLPGECSNLFLQDGYTTFFHYILAAVTSISENSIEKTFYILDLVWWILGSLMFFSIFSKYFTRRYALLGALLTALVFTNWAYEFNFFIPQTLAFLFFLNFIYDEANSKVKLLVSMLLLILTHFVIGSYLAVFLLIYFIFSKNRNSKSTNYWILLIGLATANLAFLLHLSKFSFESTFQTDALKVIGGATNALFPDSLGVILNTLGFGTIIFGLALVAYIFSKHKTPTISLYTAFVFICIATYFIGPTYAAKFLIGVSIYSIFLILNHLRNLKFDKGIYTLVAIVLVFMFSFNFISNYRGYLEFYTREANTISAVANSDENVISYLQKNTINCILVSDPYTQLLINGLTNYTTVNAQYMSIETRKSLSDFVISPTLNNYRNLQGKIKELSDLPICFLYTSRLQTSVTDSNKAWVDNIYQYLTDNKYTVDNLKLENFFKQNNIKAAYTDSFYILYK